MATTNLTNLKANALSNVVSTVLSTTGVSSVPKITTITYPGDDTAANTGGNQTISISGTGFNTGASVIVNGTAASVVSVVSPTSLTFTAPAQSSGTYTLYVVNTDGGTAIAVPGISYSGTPTWSTAAGSIATLYEASAVSNTVTATGDATIAYSLFSGTLPTGSSLNTSTGLISGTSVATNSPTTYSFTIRATDGQNQDTDRAFSITINPDAVTWSSPEDQYVTSLAQDSAMTAFTMNASSAAGKSITYTANSLPTGLSVSGATIVGTPTVIGNSGSLITATAATTGRTATRTFNWVVSVSGDTYWPYNTLLINAETPSIPFNADASTNAFPITVVGDTKPNYFNPYTPGYYSNYFDGTGDYLSSSGSTAFTMGTGAFTVEYWVYQTVNTSTYTQHVGSATTSSGFAFGVNTLTLYMTTSTQGYTASAAITLNTWNHIAWTRDASGFVRGFLNGVLVYGPTSITTNITLTNFGIGQTVSGTAYSFTGYLSNVRVVKGTAVYTAAFTPSTTPLTAIANTSLLTCQSNRFIDNSTNAFTITAAGNTTVNSFDPFVLDNSYSTYGSTYFDGTGDYLTVPDNSTWAFSGDFTIESWIYPTTLAAETAIFTVWYGGSVSLTAINFNVQSTGRLRGEFTVGSSAATTTTGTTTSVTINQWNHVAVSRSGTTIRLFVNGVQDSTTGTLSGTINNLTDQPVIGAINSGGAYLSRMNGYISDVRVITGTAVYTANFTPPTTPLTAIANTSLLTLQYNQPNNNNLFLDSSSATNIITRAGNATQGTFSPYGDDWSNYFDGTGDYLNIASNSAFAFGTSDFTIEFWAYPTVNTRQDWIDFDNGAGYRLLIYYDGTNIIYYSGAARITGSAMTLNTWQHIAVVRSSGSTKLYINGSQSGSTYSDSINFLAQPLSIGKDTAGSTHITGYMSNIRVVKGTAVYTAAFTPSTTPLTAIANTSLLTCQSNSLIDNSPNSFVITKNGDTSVQRFSPFGNYTVTPTSYSNFFDGTGDDLATPSSSAFAFGTGDFTVEGWVYITSAVGSTVGFWQNGTSDSCNLQRNTSGNLQAWDGADHISSTPVPSNTWCHVVFCRSGATAKIFVNGVQALTWTSSVNYSAASTWNVGYTASGTNRMFGYISNLSVVKGTAVYTNAFTPPAAPLTAIANTSLLTCQSTTMIDNSTNAFAITASGDTKPRKFNPFGYTTSALQSYDSVVHGGSVYFDGTGDYLTIPTNVAFSPSTGDFTLEAWVYPTTAAGTLNMFFAHYSSGVSFYRNTGGKLEIAQDGVAALATSTNNISVNSWSHVVACRSGTTLKLFINGVQEASVTNSTNLTGSGAASVGASGDSYYLNGYISNLRILKGTAVYTSNFVPPATPLTAIRNSVFLLDSKPAILDYSMMNNLETVGNAQLSTSIKKYGSSSMYFDGTGDYLTSPSSTNYQFGTGNYTIEAWIYPTNWSSSGSNNIVNIGTYITGLMIRGQSTSGIEIYTNNTQRLNLTTGITANTWQHIALVRNGSACTFYVNGSSIGTFTDSSSIAPAAAILTIGMAAHNSIEFYTGYIDDLRITKGFARYTSAFTPPAAALDVK